MSLDFEDDDIGQNKNDYDNYDTNDEMIEVCYLISFGNFLFIQTIQSPGFRFRTS